MLDIHFVQLFLTFDSSPVHQLIPVGLISAEDLFTAFVLLKLDSATVEGL